MPRSCLIDAHFISKVNLHIKQFIEIRHYHSVEMLICYMVIEIEQGRSEPYGQHLANELCFRFVFILLLS